MSFAFVFSSSSGSGSGSGWGSGIGSGFGSYSYSESYAGQNQQSSYADYSTGFIIWLWFLQIAACTIASIVLMFTGNAVLKKNHHGHLSRTDTISVAAIGPVFIFLLFIAIIVVLSALPNVAFFRKFYGSFASLRRNRYFNLVFEPVFVASVGALDGAVGGSLLYLFKLPRSTNARLQPMDILYATEAGMIGASVLLGGFYALIILGAFLFLGPRGLYKSVRGFFIPPKPQVRSTPPPPPPPPPPQQQTEDSPPTADPRIAQAEV